MSIVHVNPKKNKSLYAPLEKKTHLYFSVEFYIKEKGGHVFGHLMAFSRRLHVGLFETLFDVERTT